MIIQSLSLYSHVLLFILLKLYTVYDNIVLGCHNQKNIFREAPKYIEEVLGVLDAV